MKMREKLLKNKKGFTLVEMIVVIVIIGLLLAVLVPGMIKYIDKAKDKQIEVNARTAYLAVQTQVSEEYGKNGVTLAEAISTTQAALEGTGTIHGLPNGTISGITVDGTTGVVTGMVYAESGKTATLAKNKDTENLEWTIK